MREPCKIRVILVVFSLVAGISVFSNVVFAGDTPGFKVSEWDFVNVSFWPQSFQDFLRFELIYGDRKIDEFEARYLVDSIFQSEGKIEEEKIQHNIQSIADILTLLPSESPVTNTFISQVISRTGYSGEQVKKIIDEELEKNLSEINSVKSVCEEIISKGGDVSPDKENDTDLILYQLLKTKGITPGIYSGLVFNNHLDINEALEILKLINEPDDYVFAFTENILKNTEVTSEKFKLAELSEYMSDSAANKLLDMLFDTIPHSIDEQGRTIYSVRNIGMESTLQVNLAFMRGHVRLHSEYLNAQKNGNLSGFFASRSLPAGELYGDKAWLLYRYHSPLMPQLIEIYRSVIIPPDYNKAELKSVFSSFLSFSDILPVQVPSLAEVRNLVNTNIASNVNNSSSSIILAAIGRQLNRNPDTLTDEDYKRVESLTLLERNISDIASLSNLTNLRELTLGTMKIHDIYILTNLTNLQSLNLNGTQVNDISALANLTSLQSLGISRARASDIKLLSGLSNLKSLRIGSQQPIDTRPLEKLTNLKELSISGRLIRNDQINELKKALPNLEIKIQYAR